jgi:hypothetical protein
MSFFFFYIRLFILWREFFSPESHQSFNLFCWHEFSLYQIRPFVLLHGSFPASNENFHFFAWVFCCSISDFSFLGMRFSLHHIRLFILWHEFSLHQMRLLFFGMSFSLHQNKLFCFRQEFFQKIFPASDHSFHFRQESDDNVHQLLYSMCWIHFKFRISVNIDNTKHCNESAVN